MLPFLAAAVLGAACQEVAVPRALTARGGSDRICFFGSERAFENAYLDAVKAVDCHTIDADPPTCTCPSTVDPSACNSYGVNLFRLYSPSIGGEGAAVTDLVARASAACNTFGGQKLPPEQTAGLEPDGIVPACGRLQPSSSQDTAVFTAYMVVSVLFPAFTIFEIGRTPQLTRDGGAGSK